MANIFKTNNRFECLSEKDMSYNRRSAQPDSRYNRFNTFKKKPVYEFNNDNFPVLFNNIDIQTVNNSVSYLDKINVAPIVITDIVPNLDPGWCSIELDRRTNKSTFINYACTHISSNNNPMDCERVIDNLNSKYADFVENYIELWGEPEYLKMFCFPNHDYDYFDKLDYDNEEFMDNLHNRDNYNFQIDPYAEMHYN